MGTLAAEIRHRLGSRPALTRHPLVSAIVVNRNGGAHLRRLLHGLIACTDYPNLELVLIDNGSDDDSLEVAHSAEAEATFRICIVANLANESFSAACNQGAGMAGGELLLLLNNDIEPFESAWLEELVACHERSPGAGAVAATLLCREEEHAREFAYGYGVQHRGLELVEEDGRAHPGLRGWEDDPLDEALGADVECDAVAAACMLVGKRAYEEVGGFSPGYVYGCEDVDFCLKLRRAGMRVICSGRSIAIHHPASTRRTLPFEQAREAKLANRRLLWERWGPRLQPGRKQAGRRISSP